MLFSTAVYNIKPFILLSPDYSTVLLIIRKFTVAQDDILTRAKSSQSFTAQTLTREVFNITECLYYVHPQ